MASEMTPAAQAAADLVAPAARLVEAPVEGEQPEPVVEEAPPELPSLQADTTGIEDILEEQPEEEEEPEPPADEDDTAYDQYDPDQLQAKLRKLEKQNKWLEEQRVTSGRKTWAAEAERRFPLADVDEIKATSRRGFLKAAAESHTRYEKKLKPILGQLDQLRSDVVSGAVEEGREQAAERWGKPTGGPQQPLTERAEAQSSQAQQLDRRRHSTVAEMVKARFQHDPNLKDGI